MATGWPVGGGEMGALIRAHDWVGTPLGPVAAWSPGLRAAVQTVLDAPFPQIVLWGPDLRQLYNDGYRALMGSKHPAGLGQPTRECWPEVWHVNAPVYERVWGGESVTVEDAPYPLDPYGAVPDARFTISYSPLRDGAGAVGGVLVVVFETTGRHTAIAAQEEAERERVLTERAALIRRIVRAQEEERARVAREIHDGVTQLAHAAALRLDGLVEADAGRLTTDERQALERARDLTRRAAADARRLIAGLRPETLDELGLSGALRQDADALRADGWTVDVADEDLVGVRLDPDAEITLYRVAQEALTNVRRHAGAARVRLALDRVDGRVRLEVRDWGCGFDPRAVRATPAGEHVGLAGMRERMALLGGRLEVRSAPGGGTTVRAWAPVEPPS